ncbi:MAG: pyridoxal-phosphate dependent enzyme [Deltaproteobacteria bacterium]|nr:pyridoxal-phosphate dependent enzyme [Deltaproteobacteria bacterium]
MVFTGLLCLMGAAAQAAELPLYSHYPSLKKSLARVEIIKEATPLLPMAQLEARIGATPGSLWVKRDDISDSPLGGNKARKLEFLLAQVFAHGSDAIVTSGMWGSNHALATAVAAHEYGFKARLILGPQPVTDDVRHKILAMHALGAELRYHGNRIAMGLDMVGQMIASFFSKKLYYVPPGGSNDVGDLGYVSAFLELFDQVGIEGLPQRIYLPVGTMGTSAGLLVGSCLAGVYERVKIEGVNVADPLLTGDATTRRQAAHLYKFIKKHLDDRERARLPRCDFWSKKAFEFISEYYAPGYGAAKPEVFAGMKVARETESIVLDRTYSGKAWLAFLERVEAEAKSGKPVPKTLFWHTYNSYDLDRTIATHPWKNPDEKWRELPKDFHWMFEKPKAPGRRGD